MDAPITHVAIVGAGAMGCMYASHFARAGFDVRFLADETRAAQIREANLTVNGAPLEVAVLTTPGNDYDWAGSGAIGTDAAAAEATNTACNDDWIADLVIFAVKDRHLDAGIDLAAPCIAAHTVVLSVLNGLDSEQRIEHRLGGMGTVLLTIALAMDAEKQVSSVIFRQAGKLVFGQAQNTQVSAEVRRVQEALTAAELAWETPEDMLHRMWWKFMVNVGINQASAVLNQPYGGFQHDGAPRALMSALVDEVVAVANAEGVPLGQADISAWHDVLAAQPQEGRTSMHQDVLAGRPTEVDSFGARVVTLGAKHEIPTPYNQAMVWVLNGTRS